MIRKKKPRDQFHMKALGRSNVFKASSSSIVVRFSCGFPVVLDLNPEVNPSARAPTVQVAGTGGLSHRWEVAEGGRATGSGGH